jgi:hypothetical protein
MMVEYLDRSNPEVAPPLDTRTEPSVPKMSLLDWLAGLVLATFSPTYYFVAARQSVIPALAFFVLFALIITIFQTVPAAIGLSMATPEIQQVFEDENFPDITIANGIAEVEGPQPQIFVDEEGIFMAADTSGEITQIDRNRYYQGMLLTRTDLHVLNQSGRYQQTPLSEVQTVLGDPFVLNAETAPVYWQRFVTWFSIGTFVTLILWNTFVRMAYILALGLVFWGIAALIRRGTGLKPVVITGILALVPALFLRAMLSLPDFTLPWGNFGLTTLLYLPIWAVFLILALLPRKVAGKPARASEYFSFLHPLRSWRALIALPLIADLVAMLVVPTLHHWGITVGLALVTFGALFAVSLLPLAQAGAQPPAESTIPPAPGV